MSLLICLQASLEEVRAGLRVVEQVCLHARDGVFQAATEMDG